MVLTNEYQFIGASDSFKANSAKFHILMYAKTDADMSTGNHNVTLKMRLATQYDAIYYGYESIGSAEVGGVSAFSWPRSQVPKSNWKDSEEIIEGGVEYKHYVDLMEGTATINAGWGAEKTVTIKGSFKWYSSLLYSGEGILEVDVTLPMIAGASTITSASNVTLGNACGVTWTPLADSFRYRLKFDLGEFSHTTDMIHPNTTEPYTYNGYVIPLEAAEQVTDAPSADMTATLYTFTDSTSTEAVGEASAKDFVVTVPDDERTKPLVDMDIALVTDLLPPFDGFFLQNLTKVGADISANGRYGAGIVDRQLTVCGSAYGEPFTSDILAQTGEVTVTGTATDSRGYVGKTEQTIYVIPYDKPALLPGEGEIDIVCRRCDGDGVLTDSGTYLRVKARKRYSPVVSDGEQYNFCRFRYRCGGDWIPLPAEGDEIDIVLDGVVTSITQAYTIEVGVVDDLGKEDSAVIIVPSDQVEFHLREKGEGAAFGEYAEDARVLSIADGWELRVKGTMTIGGKTLLDLFYPVGSIYMSVNATNPATFLGGTWDQMGSADFADYIWKRTE